MALRWSAIALAILLAALHAFVLPAQGFFSGDQGAKFLQARAFADHPLNPGIDVRSVDVDSGFRYQEPILKNQRGLLVAEFSWLLPLITAPFLALFGLQGLYVVPALSAIVIFLCAAAIGRSPGDPAGVRTAWLLVLASPVLFYGSELWEHAPAAASVMAAGALVLSDGRQLSTPNFQFRKARFMAAGALIAIGALFREEAALALPAFWIAWCFRPSVIRHRPSAIGDRPSPIGNRPSAMAWSTAGAVAVLIATIPLNLLVYGTPLPLHLTAEVAKASSFWGLRRSIAAELLLPRSHRGVFATAACVGIGAAVLRAFERWRADVQLGIVHASAAVLLVIGVVLPLSRHIGGGVSTYDAYNVMSAAHTWPFWIALLYWSSGRGRQLSVLLISGVVMIAGALLIIPSSGGAQWSPRYLFVVAPLLALPAVAMEREPGLAGGRWMVRAVLIASIAMQIDGILYLRGAKLRNARLTDRVAARTAAGDVLLTDLYWFPEVTATLAPSRRMLFTWNASEIPAIAAIVTQHGFRRFGIVTSPLSGYHPPETIATAAATCRSRPGAALPLDDLGLMLNRYTCEDR